MPFDFNAVTKLIQSPPGQLVAGATLGGIVWKFFEKVEGVLSDMTKFEIAVWLVGVEFGKKVEPWPQTFATVFDRVFGQRHLSWKCFRRSAIASLLCGLLGFVLVAGRFSDHYPLIIKVQTFEEVSLPSWMAVRPLTHYAQGTLLFWPLYLTMVLFEGILLALIINVIPDYLSLLGTRLILKLMNRHSNVFSQVFFLFLDVVVTVGIAVLWISPFLMSPFPTVSLWTILLNLLWDPTPAWNYRSWLVYPALFTSIWLWLYAGSGFLLIAARRLDIGFQWFNRKFDIEKKPLSAIGLVSGALVAVAYWTVAVAVRVIK